MNATQGVPLDQTHNKAIIPVGFLELEHALFHPGLKDAN